MWKGLVLAARRRQAGILISYEENFAMKRVLILVMLCSPGLFAQGLQYGTYMGGSGDDIGHGIALGAFNEMYIVGEANSPNFPVLNAIQPHLAGIANAFVASFESNGKLLWSTYLGGSGMDKGTAIATDSRHNIYVTGFTNSIDFPVTAGVVQKTLNGLGNNAFVAKLSPAGKLIWSTYLGAGQTQGFSIAADNRGNVYVAGSTAGAGGTDGFVTELNPTASEIVWTKTIGGSGIDSIQSIALLNGEVYATGYTNSTDFPTTAGVVQRNCGTSCTDYYNGFVAKIGESGVSYATYLGGNTTTVPGTTFNLGIGITVNTSGQAFVTGTTNTVDFPVTTNAFQKTYGGTTDLSDGTAGCIDFVGGMFPCGDAYAVKLNATGTAIEWATYLGGSTADIGYIVTLDTKGNVWIAGYTQSYSCPGCSPPHFPFPTTANAYQSVKGGGLDAFMSEISPDGSTLIYSTYYGGTEDEEAFGFTLDLFGNGYLMGRTISLDTPITANAFQKNLEGGINVFLAVIKP
jgi:hypothetical protein